MKLLYALFLVVLVTMEVVMAESDVKINKRTGIPVIGPIINAFTSGLLGPGGPFGGLSGPAPNLPPFVFPGK